MSAEPIREATDAERDAQLLRGIREAYELSPLSLRLTGEELALVIRIADERDGLRRAFCEEPERPSPYAGAPYGVAKNYLVTRCAHCPHAPHGAGYICHDSQTCGCRGGLS